MSSLNLTSTRTRVAAAVTALAAVTAVVLVTAGQPSATGAAATTLKLRFEPGGFKFIDMPPRAQDASSPPSMGDYFVLNNKLFRGQKRVGSLQATCLFTNRASNPDRLKLLCHGAYNLPRGTLVGATLTAGQDRVTRIAITGGTGRFAGMNGTAIERAGSGGTGHVVIRVR